MLALQYLFANATPERPGLYLATVSEPFDKVVRYGQTLSFFDPRLVGRSVFFEDLARVVEDGGLPGVLGEINRLIRTRAPGIIVIDSFRPLSAYGDEQEFRTFLTDLAGVLSVLDTSTFWVGEYEPSERGGAPEFAVADTIIALESAHHRERTVRELRVLKLRGSGFASGAHAYRLTEDGLRVFPRLADDADEAPYPFRAARVPSGVPALDDMLGEGYIAGAFDPVHRPHGMREDARRAPPDLPGQRGRGDRPDRLLPGEPQPARARRRQLRVDARRRARRGALQVAGRPLHRRVGLRPPRGGRADRRPPGDG